MINLADSKGYTLLEVLIVVAILSIVLIPISVFFQEYIRKMSSEDLLNNKQLAQNVMEQVLKSREFDDRDTVIVLNNRSYQVNIESNAKENMLELVVSSTRAEVDSKPVILKRYIYVKENTK